jgi:hypothetical protein
MTVKIRVVFISAKTWRDFCFHESTKHFFFFSESKREVNIMEHMELILKWILGKMNIRNVKLVLLI